MFFFHYSLSIVDLINRPHFAVGVREEQKLCLQAKISVNAEISNCYFHWFLSNKILHFLRENVNCNSYMSRVHLFHFLIPEMMIKSYGVGCEVKAKRGDTGMLILRCLSGMNVLCHVVSDVAGTQFFASSQFVSSDGFSEIIIINCSLVE